MIFASYILTTFSFKFLVQNKIPMENSNKIIPPHLNAEVYRTDTTGTSTLSYLDYIQLHPDGTVLVGCSELTGRYWNGGANIFKNIADGENCVKSAKKNISLTNGTAAGCFLDNSNRIFLCEDSGAVSIWATNDDVWKQWNEETSVSEHDDAILAVDCLNPGKEYVTAGADGNVKVWDMCDLICIRNYKFAHTMAVNSVSVRPASQTNFATGSLDQFISLWDENISKPVCDLIKNNCGIRSLQWLDENRLIFGDDAGILSLLDIRNSEISLKLMEFPAAVHHIAVQPGSNRIAVCCDNKTLTACEFIGDANVKNVYVNKSFHKSFIRDVSWDLNDRDIIYSVGWDGMLYKHKLNNEMNCS